MNEGKPCYWARNFSRAEEFKAQAILSSCRKNKMTLIKMNFNLSQMPQ